MKLVLSKADEVVDPPVHDARLRGLLLCDDGNVLLPFTLSNGKRICLIARDVLRLRANGFVNGNIVLSVTLSEVSAAEAADIACAYGVEQGDAFVQRVIDDLVAQKALVMRIDPSFGAELVCICRSVEAVEDDCP